MVAGASGPRALAPHACRALPRPSESARASQGPPQFSEDHYPDVPRPKVDQNWLEIALHALATQPVPNVSRNNGNNRAGVPGYVTRLHCITTP